MEVREMPLRTAIEKLTMELGPDAVFVDQGHEECILSAFLDWYDAGPEDEVVGGGPNVIVEFAPQVDFAYPEDRWFITEMDNMGYRSHRLGYVHRDS